MIGSCGMGGLGSAQTMDTTYNTVTAVGGTIASVGGPIGGAVGALIAAGAQIAKALKIGYGCGPTCQQATQIVNSAESVFNQNVDEYESGGIDQATELHPLGFMPILRMPTLSLSCNCAVKLLMFRSLKRVIG